MPKDSAHSVKGLIAFMAKSLRSNARTAAYATAGFFALYTFMFGLWKIPVVDFGFTRNTEIAAFDIAYILSATLMSGALAALVSHRIAEFRMHAVPAGAFAGFVSAVCPACQGITVAALGSSVFFIPLEFIASMTWIMQILSLLLLGASIYMVSWSSYTNTCTFAIGKKSSMGKAGGHFLYENDIAFSALILTIVLVVLNGLLIGTVFSSNNQSITLKPGFEYGPKTTLKPMPLATGESPRISGYKSIVKPMVTISEMPMMPSTGDVAQDIANNIIPRGTPWYGAEAGVTFDDPVGAQNLWGKGRAIQLSAEEQQRWEHIVNSFTCDYCCGSPQNPTIITGCVCAHSLAAQGMAKWFIKNYGSRFTDEEIYGEMARWYALWYPGPTVKRIIQELQT